MESLGQPGAGAIERQVDRNASTAPADEADPIMSPEPPRRELVRWAAIVGTREAALGRVVVEAETSDAARDKVERKGYIVLEVNRDNSGQAVSF